MNNWLILIITFVIIIIFTHIILTIKEWKPKPKTPKKKIFKEITNQIEIDQELKKIEKDRSVCAVPKKIVYKHSNAIHPENKGIIIWNQTFLRSLEWKRYEEVCMEYLRIKNCAADVTCIGADGGIDIKIKDNNGNMLAIGQCKAWNKPIGVSLIRELYGVMAGEQVKHGIFLTTSIFSQDALEFAKNKTLILIDGNKFVNLINGLSDTDKRRIDRVATEGDYTTPTCVNCNVKMVKRIATKGKNEGNEFWGCVNFPRCKKTMFVKA